MCGMTVVEDNDNFDWEVWSGETPSLETGPDFAYNGEFYIYTEATNKAAGSKAL